MKQLHSPHMTRRQLVEGGLLMGGLALSSVVMPTALHASATQGPVVRTPDGALRGLATETLTIFKGIRYAESPTGARRFRAPQPVKPWRGVRDATRLGAPAIQDNPDLPAWSDPGQPSEDCLFLNVWSPRKPGPHPVMVFFHGGAFAYGSGGVPIYDGGALAERGDVVVVTINHRITIFGYLYLAGLSRDYAHASNPGHQDLVEALRWIRRNIAKFGGDSGNVTIFGESGGGAKVSYMLATPMAKGLFHKAIVQSGSALRVRTADAATAEAEAVLGELQIPVGELAKLENVSTERIMQACRSVGQRATGFGFTALPFVPTLDAHTIPLQPDDLASRRRWKNIPLLVGSTEAEAAFFLTTSGPLPDPSSDAELVEKISAGLPSPDEGKAQQILAAYRQQMPGASRQQLLVSVATAQIFGADAVRQAEMKAQLGGAPVYMYQFGWKEPCFDEAWAVHAADLPFVFDKLADGPLWDETDTAKLRAERDPEGLRYKLRDAVIAAWAGFAHSGAPGNPHLPTWPAYRIGERAVMRLDGVSRLVQDPMGPSIRSLMVG